MKVLALCALLALARSETIIVGVVNYAAMYDNECATTTVAPVAGDAVLNVDNAANDNNAANDDTSDVAGADIEMSDTSNGEGYAQKYENKYAKKYENKYEKKYEGVGSVPGNENGGDTDKNPEATQQSTFCKCLAKVKKTGKSYAESQNDFSKCIDKANGNDAEHWEKVAKEYEHKFGYKTDDTWNLKQTDIEGVADAAVDAVDNEEKSVVDKAKEEESEVDKDAGEEVENVEKSVAAIDNEEDNTDNTDNTDNADNTDNTDKTDNVEDVDNADNVDVEKKEDVEVQDVDGVDKTDKEDTEDVDIQAPLPQNVGGDDKFGNAAIYIAFIGASVLLFICAWAIKNGFKKWKMREYENVKQMSSYKSEQDADNNGDIYSDWDDNYDQNYARNQQDKGKKGRFSGWNQYSSV